MATNLKEGPLRCDCCAEQQLAILRGTKLVITDRRHGKTHMLVIELDAREHVCIESLTWGGKEEIR